MSRTAKGWARFIYPSMGGDVRLIEGVDVPYTEWQANRVGILDGTPNASSIGLDFGTVSNATAIIFKNNNNSEMKVSIPAFNLVPGAILLIIQPDKSAGANPLASVQVRTTALQVGAGQMETLVAAGIPLPGGGGGGGGGGGTPGFFQKNDTNDFFLKNAANDFFTIG